MRENGVIWGKDSRWRGQRREGVRQRERIQEGKRGAYSEGDKKNVKFKAQFPLHAITSAGPSPSPSKPSSPAARPS